MASPVIGYAGLTHLGLCSAVAAASLGFDVVGWDADAARAARIAAGDLPVSEPELDGLLAAHRARLTFGGDAALLGRCDVVFVAVDVPTDDAGRSDLAVIDAAIARAAAALAPGAVLVVLSQVPPGFTRRIPLAPERLFYQVETLIFGRAVERATRPERFMVGCADPARPLPGPYAAFLAAFGCPILPMRIESAELAKIAINCFLAASVTTTNTLAELSAAVGADWAEIAPALRLDARIGPKAYLTPGLGIAGGNIERDLATVVALGAEQGSDTAAIAAFAASSRHMQDWAWRTLERVVLRDEPQARLGVLGLAYKADTHSTKNSPALALLARLHGRANGGAVAVHDPVVPAATVPFARAAADPVDAAVGADALLIMTPWAAYRQIAPGALAAAMRGRAVIDPYGVLAGDAVGAAGLDHYTIGRPPRRAARTTHA
jgi:UDPglucose 6-dehydrogenase